MKQKEINEHDERIIKKQEFRERVKAKRISEIQKDNERLLGSLVKISIKKEKKRCQVFKFINSSHYLELTKNTTKGYSYC